MADLIGSTIDVAYHTDVQFWVMWLTTNFVIAFMSYRVGRHHDCPHGLIIGRKDCIHDNRIDVVLDDKTMEAFKSLHLKIKKEQQQ